MHFSQYLILVSTLTNILKATMLSDTSSCAVGRSVPTQTGFPFSRLGKDNRKMNGWKVPGGVDIRKRKQSLPGRVGLVAGLLAPDVFILSFGALGPMGRTARMSACRRPSWTVEILVANQISFCLKPENNLCMDT